MRLLAAGATVRFRAHRERFSHGVCVRMLSRAAAVPTVTSVGENWSTTCCGHGGAAWAHHGRGQCFNPKDKEYAKSFRMIHPKEAASGRGSVFLLLAGFLFLRPHLILTAAGVMLINMGRLSVRLSVAALESGREGHQDHPFRARAIRSIQASQFFLNMIARRRPA